jgi:hypothetical protein
MKKILLVTGLTVLVVAALGVGIVYAQGGQPPLMGMMVGQDGYGWMHQYVQQAFAAKLGLTEQQVQDQLAAGKTMYQIALDKGIKQEDFATFMNDVHKDAFASAVKAGVVTQEQADWMLQRMQNMYQNGTGFGNCPMHNGQGTPSGQGRGTGPGMMGNGYGAGMMSRSWSQGAQNP